MEKINLDSIKNEFLEEFKTAETKEKIEELYKKYLSDKGKIRIFFSSLKNFPPEEKKLLGQKANDLKNFFIAEIQNKEKTIKTKTSEEFQEFFDITLPAEKISFGHLHPLTIVAREINKIFESMGFEIADGPEIETEWYNFDALNIPQNHPARDMWDTLWLKTDKKLLLRTHTSPVQIRYMQQHKPPIRIIVPGKVFRHEATDSRHEINFHQVEGLMIEKRGTVTVAGFKAILKKFFEKFFAKNLEIKLRPSFFPFTEPSFEIDFVCPICRGKGCALCKSSGWLETMGAGMVHPTVLKNSGINPSEWQGFAFGLGMERFAMIKYRIDDIRIFHSGDLRFLYQF